MIKIISAVMTIGGSIVLGEVVFSNKKKTEKSNKKFIGSFIVIVTGMLLSLMG